VRTTLDIDDDVLIAAKDRAKMEGRTTGAVLSELARKGLVGAPRPKASEGFLGFRPLPKRGAIVTNELIDALREEIGD
jgi:hypothetical protein